MIEFFNRLFGRQPSSTTAKERLRLVLMSDHLSLAPEMVEQMKRDFVDVISKYVEVDRTKIEVSFEQQDKALAMLANVPIVSVNRTPAAPPSLASETAAATAAPAAAAPSPASAPASAAAPASAGARPRRRRKKKPADTQGSAPPVTAYSSLQPGG